MPRDILIIDDEADIRAAIQGVLEDEGYTARQAGNVESGLEQLVLQLPDLVILDVWLKTGERDGLNLLTRIRRRWPDLPILMISGHANIEMAVSAIKQGAYDFIEKPFQADRLLLTLDRALEAAALRQENQTLKERVEGAADLLGDSGVVQTIRQAIERVAPTNSRVLITGLPGTGKEVAARMIHRLSVRAARSFVAVNCALMDPLQIEGELFGSAHHPGLIHQADGGTLFLDEVGDLPLACQIRLLRVLQEQKYQHPVTGAWIEVDVRVLSASSVSLPERIKSSAFREDLYYRLNVVDVHMPALADRREDVPSFIQYFMAQCARASAKPLRPLTPGAMTALQLYAWPGNVRQVKNVAEWLVIMAPGANDAPIDIGDLPPEITQLPVQGAGLHISPELLAQPLREAREQFERAYLHAQISRFGGSVSRAAQFVGMERSALHRKLKSLGAGSDDTEENDNAREVA